MTGGHEANVTKVLVVFASPFLGLFFGVAS